LAHKASDTVQDRCALMLERYHARDISTISNYG